MMPKGVEHFLSKLFRALLFGVGIPMMPKGVEHLIWDETFEQYKRRGNSDDAERR